MNCSGLLGKLEGAELLSWNLLKGLHAGTCRHMHYGASGTELGAYCWGLREEYVCWDAKSKSSSNSGGGGTCAAAIATRDAGLEVELLQFKQLQLHVHIARATNLPGCHRNLTD